MRHTDGIFTSVRDLKVYHQAWLPEGEIKSIILIIHGLGEHSGRYTNVTNYFVPRGYAIYSFDNIGHGKSDNGREEINRFEELTAPATAMTAIIKEWPPQSPIFIYGHSMGALITSFHLLDRQADFKGAIISAPLVTVPAHVSSMTVRLGKILSVIAPRMGLVNVDPSSLSRDKTVVEAYINDPLVFQKKAPARISAEMLRAMMRVTAEVEKISLPLFILQGSSDYLVDPNGAQLLEKKAGSTDKTLKIYEGLYHEVHNEPERELMFKDLETWLENRI